MDISKVMERVAKLLDTAEHPNTPDAERDACRERADQMMLKYAIEEDELNRTKEASSRSVPTVVKFDVCDAKSHLQDSLIQLVGTVASHFRCRVVFQKYGYGSIKAVAVGYESDLKFLQFMFGQLHLHLSGELEPKPDPAKSFDANVYALHEAGVKWQRIAQLMNAAYSSAPDRMHAWREAVRVGKDGPGVLVPWPDGKRLITAYRRHCAAIGDRGRAIQSPLNYQQNLAAAYCDRIWVRLDEMRRRYDVAGTSLALRTEDVDLKVSELFPELGTMKLKNIRVDEGARQRGRAAANRADLGGSKVQNPTRTALD